MVVTNDKNKNGGGKRILSGVNSILLIYQ